MAGASRPAEGRGARGHAGRLQALGGAGSGQRQGGGVSVSACICLYQCPDVR